jgi:hypothetical protein
MRWLIAGALPVTQHLQNTWMSDLAQFMGCFWGAPWTHKRSGGKLKRRGSTATAWYPVVPASLLRQRASDLKVVIEFESVRVRTFNAKSDDSKLAIREY